MTGTPSRYTKEAPKYRDKEYLYREYWGNLRSQTDIAKQLDESINVIRYYMQKYGIPPRPQHYQPDGTQSPFIGFYGKHENVPSLDWERKKRSWSKND